jgi:hypothetical protein
VLTTPLDSNVYVAANGTIAIFNGLDVGAGPRSVIDVPGAPGLAVAEPTPSVDNRGPTHCAC